MKTIIRPNQKSLLLFLVSSIALIFILFFIDEDRNSFEGFAKPVHILTFFIYLIPTVLAQFLIFLLLNKLNINYGRYFFSIVCGLFIGIVFVISLLYLLN